MADDNQGQAQAAQSAALRATPKKGRFRNGLAIGLLTGSLVGCVAGIGIGSSGDKSGPAAKSEQASAEPSTPVTPEKVAAGAPAPTHLWQYREGKEYGYSGSISDDDRKAGQAASQIMMFRYLGEKDGTYTVASVENGTATYASCQSPCSVVKMSAAGIVQRLTFNPDSIVGAALTDAMNHQMEVYAPPKAEE